jgi:phosphate-selective porin
LNWYPNNAVRFVLDYQHTNVSRLDAVGGGLGAKLDAVSLRAQFSL